MWVPGSETITFAGAPCTRILHSSRVVVVPRRRTLAATLTVRLTAALIAGLAATLAAALPGRRPKIHAVNSVCRLRERHSRNRGSQIQF